MAAKVVNKSGCKVTAADAKVIGRGRGLMKRRGIWCKRFIFQKKKNLKTERKKIAKKIFKERKCVKCKCCVDLPESGYFASCVLVCDIIRFDLRAFLGFLSGFCVFALQLIHFDKIRGLEWLKMRRCYSGIRIIMLLRYNKRGFVGYYARVRRCVRVYVYTL